MTIFLDAMLRAFAVLVVPLVVVALYAAEKGHRRARLAAAAKTAADILNAAPPHSPMYRDLATYFDEVAALYLEDNRPEPRHWKPRGLHLSPAGLSFLIVGLYFGFQACVFFLKSSSLPTEIQEFANKASSTGYSYNGAMWSIMIAAIMLIFAGRNVLKQNQIRRFKESLRRGREKRDRRSQEMRSHR